jgi:large subunit ribosomal protein L23|uniref:ribosomal protein L23 n=1 Tax=Chattonella marina TaxID=90936 RepID=UPI002114BF8E|nr:ribosomal protein L23 [Chattonella marina]UTE94789.1 ribosomal protein L23 [Chattonella marina]
MVNHKYLRSQIDCIKYPIVTEKSAGLFEKNQYTFLVDRQTDKYTIKTAIEYLFNVKVIKVNTCLMPKKKKRLGKYFGYLPTYKKAIVKLAPDNTINLFPDV